LTGLHPSVSLIYHELGPIVAEIERRDSLSSSAQVPRLSHPKDVYVKEVEFSRNAAAEAPPAPPPAKDAPRKGYTEEAEPPLTTSVERVYIRDAETMEANLCG